MINNLPSVSTHANTPLVEREIQCGLTVSYIARSEYILTDTEILVYFAALYVNKISIGTSAQDKTPVLNNVAGCFYITSMIEWSDCAVTHNSRDTLLRNGLMKRNDLSLE